MWCDCGAGCLGGIEERERLRHTEPFPSNLGETALGNEESSENDIVKYFVISSNSEFSD